MYLNGIFKKLIIQLAKRFSILLLAMITKIITKAFANHNISFLIIPYHYS